MVVVGGLDQSFRAADGISRSSSCCGGHQRCYLIERSVFFNTAAVWQRAFRVAGRAACFRMRSQKKQKSSSRKQNNVYQQQQPCRNGSGCCCWVGVHGVVYGLRFFFSLFMLVFAIHRRRQMDIRRPWFRLLEKHKK